MLHVRAGRSRICFRAWVYRLGSATAYRFCGRASGWYGWPVWALIVRFARKRARRVWCRNGLCTPRVQQRDDGTPRTVGLLAARLAVCAGCFLETVRGTGTSILLLASSAATAVVYAVAGRAFQGLLQAVYCPDH